MTLLSRKADYALLILWFLDRRDGGASAREVAERFDLSRAFVANILKELCQQGFVTSTRGVKGGYVLARPAAAITLAGLLTALEEPLQTANCTEPGHGDGCSLTAVCPVRGPVAALHARIHEVLRSVTLAELFRPPLSAPAVGGSMVPLGLLAAPAAVN